MIIFISTVINFLIVSWFFWILELITFFLDTIGFIAKIVQEFIHNPNEFIRYPLILSRCLVIYSSSVTISSFGRSVQNQTQNTIQFWMQHLF